MNNSAIVTNVRYGIPVTRPSRRPSKHGGSKKIRIFSNEEQLVGGYVPRQVSDELSLVAIYYSTTKSDIIQSLISDRLSKENIGAIINSLAEKIYQSWKEHCAEKKKTALNFTQYRRHTRAELVSRKINPNYIQRIMVRAQELHEAYKNEQFKRASKESRSV